MTEETPVKKTRARKAPVKKAPIKKEVVTQEVEVAPEPEPVEKYADLDYADLAYPIRANVGCGEFYQDGWVNIDMTRADEGPQPDIIASADNLPFPDDSVDRLYAGHVLEHIEYDDVPIVLDEFKRVLAPEGVVMIVGPDLTVAEMIHPEMIPDIKYGGGRWNGDKHLWESRASTMYRMLLDHGWYAVLVPIESDLLTEWPVTARVPWQFAIAATPVV